MGYRGMIDLARSLPTRGAWIEIRETRCRSHRSVRRSPPGERGLKLAGLRHAPVRDRVAPHPGSVD